jgi:HPt (histidine-containing phosphotransfer) domain-containing protein
MSDTPIDLSIFAELQDTMGSDFVEELVNTFLDEAPGMFAEISSAAESGDKDEYRRAAHSIKSNADIFGGHDLVGLARQMEISGLNADADQNNAQITTLLAEYERAATTLKELIDA